MCFLFIRVLDPRLTELPRLEGITEEEEGTFLTDLLKKNPPRHRGAARGDGDGQSQPRRLVQNRAGRAAAKAARASTPTRVDPAAIGASTSRTASRSQVPQLRDEEDAAFGALNAQGETLMTEGAGHQDIFGDADEDEVPVENPRVYEIPDSEGTVDVEKEQVDEVGDEDRDGGDEPTDKDGEEEAEVSVHCDDGGSDAEMTHGDEAIGGGGADGSSIPLRIENPQPEEQTPGPSR